tara:strand:+ start:10053 stop:12305 length:2253 start_codon:yes stop_codon:yes gene_type:complete
MTYPATSYPEGVDLTIIAGNQLHQVINGDADQVVSTDGGDIPSVRKALADIGAFKPPINWVNGAAEEDPFQVRLFTDGSYYWAPSATNTDTIPMGASPVGDPNWKLAPLASNNTVSNTNLLNNHNFLIASPDSGVTPPSESTTAYPAGTQVFSDWYAGASGVSLKKENSLITIISGSLYQDIPRNNGLELVTNFIASVSDFQGTPTVSNVSYSIEASNFRVTISDGAVDVGSVKFEQGELPTQHEVVEVVTEKNLSTYTDLVFDNISKIKTSTLNTGDFVTVSRILSTSPKLKTTFKVVNSSPDHLFPLGPNHDLGGGKYLEILGNVHAEHLGAGGAIDSAPAITNYINYKISKNGYNGTDGSSYQVMHITQGTDKQFLIGSEVAISNPKCRGLRLKLKCAAIAPIDDSKQLFRFTSGTGSNEKVRDVIFDGSGLECMRLTNGVRWESCSTKGFKDSTCKGFVFFGSRTIGSGVETIMRGNEFAEFRFLQLGYNDRANMKGTAIDMDDSSGDVTDNKIFENIIIYTGTGIKGTSQNNLVSQNHIYGGNDAIICDSALWQITNNQFDSMTVRINGTERVKIVNNTWNHSASRSDDLDAVVIAPQVNNAFLQGVVIKNNNFDNRSFSATMDAVAYDTTNGTINKDQVNDSYITENYYAGKHVKKYRTEHQLQSFASGVNTQTLSFNDYLPDWASIKNVQWSWTISSSNKNIFLNVDSVANRQVKIDYFDVANVPVKANVNLFVRVDCYNGKV